MTDSPARAPSTDAAAALLRSLVQLGVRHIVLSPGSRSQALALVAAHLERQGLVRVHVRVDERVAGFTALGIGRESRMPAVALCTSGTAAAGFVPAALEAHHAGVPLLLLTADRPPELRGIGANQTTRQPGLYGSATRFDADLPVPTELDDGDGDLAAMLRATAAEAVRASLGDGVHPPGPVHLNLPYQEPLSGRLAPDAGAPGREGAGTSGRTHPESPEPDDDAPVFGALYQGGGGIGDAEAPAATAPEPRVLARGTRTVVVAGADAGPAAEQLAHLGSWPLIAEVVSGARYGRHLVHGYREVLRSQLGDQIERVIVFGRPTLSREVTALLGRDDLRVIAVRGPGEALNLNGITEHVDDVTVAAGATDRDWLAQWMRASREHTVDLSGPAPDAQGLASVTPHDRLAAIAAEVAVMRAAITRTMLVDAVWRASWPHDRLMFASSRLVRVADRVLGGKKVPVHSNRGLAGIDGTVATAVGIAIASQTDAAPGVTRVLVGDLALLHDVGALLLPPDEPEPRIQLIVGNDRGGTIFDELEVARTADPADFDRVVVSSHQVELERLAAAYGLVYHRVSTRAVLDQVLSANITGRHLIDVPLQR